VDEVSRVVTVTLIKCADYVLSMAVGELNRRIWIEVQHECWRRVSDQWEDLCSSHRVQPSLAMMQNSQLLFVLKILDR
jgi:hypothetical protein